jgi:[acyl-carrier-protein] S-malonyltransferase
MKIALMFTGQGSQHAGMGKSLHDAFPAARLVFEEAGDTLQLDMKKLCFSGGQELSQTQYAQPAILTVSVAAFRVYMNEIGIAPRIAAGHSLGEYTALACSGVLAFTDALKLVEQRGRFMQAAAGRQAGEMLSVAATDIRQLERLCEQVHQRGQQAVIACYNAAGQQVVSGHTAAITALVSRLDQLGIDYNRLHVSGAFHSPLMNEAAIQLRDEWSQVPTKPWLWPIISNIDGLPYTSLEEIKPMLVKQMTHPVRWTQTLSTIARFGVELAIELGPKTVLRNLLRNSSLDMEALAIGTSEDVQIVQEAVTKTGIAR